MAGASGTWDDKERDPLAGIKALFGGLIPEQWPGRTGGTLVRPRAASTGGEMTPFEIVPEAVGALTENINNLPPTDLLNMLYNQPQNMAAPAPAATAPAVAGPVRPAPSPGETDVANARAMAGQFANAPGLLPWDFWMKNPNVSGGMARVESGPKAGQTYSFFEPTKNQDIMGIIQPLIQQYAEKASALLSATPEQAAKMPFNMEGLQHLISGVNSLIMSQQTGTKIPSEIAKNIAEANRVQLAPNVLVGEGGQAASFVIPPGGQPKQFATGSPQEKLTAEDQAINRTIAILPSLMKTKSDLELTGQPTTAIDTILSRLLPPVMEKIIGGKTTTAAPVQQKITDQQYLDMFVAKNPGQKQLAQQYLQNAKKQHPEIFQ